ncbi:small ribosomal subunit protein uS7 [Candidatus Vidania fulgoroideorum]
MVLKKMSRKKNNFFNRKVFNDLKYNNYYISKFINIIMKSGKKSIAEKNIYKCLEMIRNKFDLCPIDFFKKTLILTGPQIEIKKKKVGGSFYFIPLKINKKRRIFHAMKFIKKNSILRKENKFYISLFKEIVETYNENSNSIKMRDEIHKKAELNRAFSHFIF